MPSWGDRIFVDLLNRFANMNDRAMYGTRQLIACVYMIDGDDRIDAYCYLQGSKVSENDVSFKDLVDDA